jgi:hypothetical protein
MYECILEYFVKHKSSWTEIEDILRLMNKIHKKNVIPPSKYLFLKNFKQGTKATFHYNCKNKECKRVTGIDSDAHQKYFVCECKTENFLNDAEVKTSFVTFSVKDQIKSLVDKYKDVLLVPKGNNMKSFPMKDVWQGKIHLDLLKSKPNGFLSLTLNTDGMLILKSSKTSLWPVFICLNNLPLRYRFKMDNLICVGFHYDKSLDMLQYLKPFTMELREINLNGGIETSHGKLNVYNLLASLDAPAKAKLQNQKQFNAHFGCSYCKEPGQSLEKSMKYINT